MRRILTDGSPGSPTRPNSDPMTARRRLRLAATAGVAVALGLSLAACGAAGSPKPATHDPVAAAKSTPVSAAALAGMEAAQQLAAALPAPAVPGTPALPGPIAKPATPASNMKNLVVTPDSGIAGTSMTISGSGLGAGKHVELTWSTANDTWSASVQPDTVDYLGRVSTDLNVVIATATTNSQGGFRVALKAPNDWGGVHDIYAVVGSTEVAHGGFLLARWATMSPRSGPIGTPITITYGGLGSLEYTGGFSVLYDNHYAGEGMSTWTRGTASVVIRASGPVGDHSVQIGNAISYLYLNVAQSPIPYTTGFRWTFKVTADDGPPAPSIDWPDSVSPTVTARTTLAKSGLAASSDVAMKLSATSGGVDQRVTLHASGLKSSSPVQLVWSTVVGNRVDCKGVCWDFVSVPLGTATPSKGSVEAKITVPYGLGGWHAVQLVQGGKIWAQEPFYVHAGIVGAGVSPSVVHEGQEFTVHLDGVGWTQLDNTFAVDYDNSYVGYACGFNSNGDVQLKLFATGGPGTHLIDLYPMLYTLSPSYANAEFGMVPVLTYANDEPGLALGYELPAIRLAVTVVG